MIDVARWIGCVALLAVSSGGGGCRCSEQGGGPQRRGPAVVVVDPEEMAQLNADPEKEPNDTRATAQLLEEGKAIGARLSSSIDGGPKTGDRDWYRIMVDDDRILTATASGVGGIDLVLEALSDEGQRLVKVDNHPEGGGETLVNLAVSAGTYHLRVQARPNRRHKRGDRAKGVAPSDRATTTGAGTYRIAYRLRPREQGEELEPNWKMPWASEVALGGEAVGYLGWHTDTDWYQVSLAERAPGALLWVELDGVDGVRAHLAVHDAKGEAIQRRVGGQGEPVVLGNLGVPAASDTLFIVVRCGREANVESPYALRVSSEVVARPTEIEPNDSAAGATSIALDKVIAGSVTDGDLDHYAVVADGPVSVLVAPPAGVDLAVAVVDSAGKVQWEVDAARGSGTEALPVAFLRAPETLVRVRAPRGNDADPRASYRLVVRRRQQPGPWESESNDELKRATPWRQIEQPMRGFLHPDEDVDHFAIPCPTSPQVARVVVGKRRPKTLALLDAGGAVLAETKAVDADGSLHLDLPASGAAPCFLRVSGGVGGAGPDDSYQLRVEGAGVE